MDILERLKTAVEEFKSLQTKYIKYGAMDTEPDSLFQWVVYEAYSKGLKTPIPRGIRGWQLLGRGPKVERAANKLSATAQQVIDVLPYARRLDLPLELKNYIAEICWRWARSQR